MEDINEEYLSDKPHSYGGKYRLYNMFKKGDVDRALKNNNIYSRFKQHRKSKKYSPIYVYRKRELFQSDVVFFTNKEFVDANQDINIYSQLLMFLQKWLGSIP